MNVFANLLFYFFQEYAYELIETHTTEMSKIMVLNYGDLPNASQNRHTLRMGKECLCQRIEKHLSLVKEQMQR